MIRPKKCCKRPQVTRQVLIHVAVMLPSHGCKQRTMTQMWLDGSVRSRSEVSRSDVLHALTEAEVPAQPLQCGGDFIVKVCWDRCECAYGFLSGALR